MSKTASKKAGRRSDGSFARRRSPLFIASIWLASFASLGLLYLMGLIVSADMVSFRSCSGNNTDLTIHSCGKQAFNVGDLALVLLFVLAAALSVSLFTMAWRLITRKRVL